MTLDCTWKQVHCCRVKFLVGYKGSTFITTILPQFNMWREKKIILVIFSNHWNETIPDQLPPKKLLNSAGQFENYRLISWFFPLCCLKTGFCFCLLYIYILPTLVTPKIHILKYSPYLASFMIYNFEYRNYIYSFAYFCSLDK